MGNLAPTRYSIITMNIFSERVSMESFRDQIKDRCIHLTLDSHKGTSDREILCSAGVSYHEVAKVAELGHVGCGLRTPCGGSKVGSKTNGHKVQPCDKYAQPTEKEIQKEIDEWEHTKDCLSRKVSSCCEAEIDESHVIKSGPCKGHGKRFCSKCKKLVYMV